MPLARPTQPCVAALGSLRAMAALASNGRAPPPAFRTSYSLFPIPYSLFSMRALRGLLVDAALRDVGELLVRGLLFVEILLQQVGRAVVLHRPRPGDQRAVGGDLVVLGALRRRDQHRVHRLVVVRLANHLVGL